MFYLSPISPTLLDEEPASATASAASPTSATESVDDPISCVPPSTEPTSVTILEADPASTIGANIISGLGANAAVVQAGSVVSDHEGLLLITYGGIGVTLAVTHSGTTVSVNPIPNAATILPVAMHPGITV